MGYILMRMVGQMTQMNIICDLPMATLQHITGVNPVI
jgi:hypothetical protein